jgi:ribosomal-protein-serine acetyltransferase
MKQLTDGTVTLRRYRVKDAREIFEAARASVNEIYPWMEWCHPDYARAESEHWVRICKQAWKEGTAYDFGIFDARTDEFLGGVGLNQFNVQRFCANLGYWVKTSAAGRGTASRATRLVARWGIESLALQRIEIIADVRNVASNRAAQKAGAKQEGVQRNRIRSHGRMCDVVAYSLTPDDLEALNAAIATCG